MKRRIAVFLLALVLEVTCLTVRAETTLFADILCIREKAGSAAAAICSRLRRNTWYWGSGNADINGNSLDSISDMDLEIPVRLRRM